jgi:16S rRNA processing protein RimM
VSVELWTDEPARRFADGAVLQVRRPAGGPAPARPSVTVSSSRWHQGRLLVAFEQVADRTAAESLRGLELSVLVAPDERPADPDEYYDHQLIGLSVTTTDGLDVGVVADVMHSGAQDLLVVRRREGDRADDALVPFVTALVPEVDLERRLLVVADRPGLLEPHDEG